MTRSSLSQSGPIMRCFGMLLLVLTGCVARWGMPEPGLGYPGELSAFAPRLGARVTYTYYPRFEAYYEHATRQFCYPNGEKWEARPTVLSSTPHDIFKTPAVPFTFADHPSKHHWQVKRAFPTNWTSAHGRTIEGHQWGYSGWDIDKR